MQFNNLKSFRWKESEVRNRKGRETMHLVNSKQGSVRQTPRLASERTDTRTRTGRTRHRPRRLALAGMWKGRWEAVPLLGEVIGEVLPGQRLEPVPWG